MYSSVKISHLFLLCAFFFFCNSCKEKDSRLVPQEYVTWVENTGNGLRVERKMPPITYSVQYKPVNYVVAKEEKSNSISSATLVKRHKELDKMQHFTLRIQTNGGDILAVNSPSQQEYYQRQNYLTYEFQNDIQLVDGKDTLSCELFQMVGNYGLAPYVDFVMGFEDKDSLSKQVINNKEFILEDKIFGNGILKFIIKKENINKIPEIKTL